MFTNCSNRTIANRDIASCRLTTGPVNNQRISNYQVIHSGHSSEILLANIEGSVAQSLVPSDTFCPIKPHTPLD